MKNNTPPGDKQVRALFVTGGNPLITMANSGRMKKAFEDLELLAVSYALTNSTPHSTVWAQSVVTSTGGRVTEASGSTSHRARRTAKLMSEGATEMAGIVEAPPATELASLR